MADKIITDLQLRGDVDDDVNVPVDDGIQTYRTTAPQWYAYMRNKITPEQKELSNFVITPSVGSSALTIAIKTAAGTDPSATDVVRAAFRSATLTSGVVNLRKVESALSLVISSGSTLGQVSGQASVIWVYLIDNAGTPELAVSHAKYSEDALVSTTAEGGAGAADSATAIYSSNARTDVPIRVIGYILNTQTTAGTWASAGTEVHSFSENRRKGPTISTLTSGSGTYYPPAGATTLRVRMVGGGGGGGGSGTTGSPGADGTGGGNTTFGTNTANGGAGSAIFSGAGGSGSVGAGWSGIALSGGDGGASNSTQSTNNCPYAGNGGNTVFAAGGGTGPQAGGAGGSGVIIIEEYYE